MTNTRTACALALWGLLALSAGLRAQQPNVLLVIADDLGVDRVGAYGAHPDPGRTPVIDALAADGVLFRNAWSNPSCGPTRATLLTGRYARTTGFIASDFETTAFELALDELTLPEALAPAYRSAAVGKWHLASKYISGVHHPNLSGFERFRGTMATLGAAGQGYFHWDGFADGVPFRSTTYNTTACVDDALQLIADFGNDPWFLWLAFHAPHGPFHKPPAALHGYALPDAVGSSIPVHYQAAVEAMDTELGRLLASMDPAVRARTVVIFVGDNGTPGVATTPPTDPLRAKGTLYQGGIHVPLIVSGPGVQAGAECAALVNTTDVFATVLGLAGSAVAPPADSVSFLPQLAQPGLPGARTSIYAEDFRPNGHGPYQWRLRAVRDERYKLMEAVHPASGTLLRELYDLLADPAELDDLLDGPLTATQAATYFALDALLAEPYQAWRDVARPLAGSAGEPRLEGTGAASSGAAFGLTLSAARPGSLAVLALGLENLSVWFELGVWVPSPDLLVFLTTDASGAIPLAGVWPPGIPPGAFLLFQFWIQDPAGPLGWASSAGLAATFE